MAKVVMQAAAVVEVDIPDHVIDGLEAQNQLELLGNLVQRAVNNGEARFVEAEVHGEAHIEAHIEEPRQMRDRFESRKEFGRADYVRWWRACKRLHWRMRNG